MPSVPLARVPDPGPEPRRESEPPCHLVASSSAGETLCGLSGVRSATLDKAVADCPRCLRVFALTPVAFLVRDDQDGQVIILRRKRAHATANVIGYVVERHRYSDVPGPGDGLIYFERCLVIERLLFGSHLPHPMWVVRRDPFGFGSDPDNRFWKPSVAACLDLLASVPAKPAESFTIDLERPEPSARRGEADARPSS